MTNPRAAIISVIRARLAAGAPVESIRAWLLRAKLVNWQYHPRTVGFIEKCLAAVERQARPAK